MIYCIVPRELAPKAHEALRRHFADDPSVEVVVERRVRDRRDGSVGRRTTDGGGAAAGAAGLPDGGADRRQVRHPCGRRIGDRRGAARAVAEPPELPRKLRRYAEQLAFVERAGPSELELEDEDTARLVTRIQAGEERHFDTIYLRYFDRVFTHLKMVLNDPHEAEDATQEVFTRMFQALPGYELRAGTPFRGWLFTIARNHSLTLLRQLGRIDVEPPEEIERLREREAAEEDEPREPFLDGVSWLNDSELAMFVERLPLAQRQVLVLRYLLDLTFPEIARTLGRSSEAVRKLHGRAVEQLHDRLVAIGRGPKSGGRRSAMVAPLRQARVVRNRRSALTPWAN